MSINVSNVSNAANAANVTKTYKEAKAPDIIKRGAALLCLIPFIMVSLTSCAFGFGASGEGENADSSYAQQEELALPVTVVSAVRQDMERTVTVGGLLRPQEEVAMMGGGVGSRILSIDVAIGDHVSRGQTILTQDMRDLAIQEQNLQVSRLQLQDSIRIMEDNYRITRDTYERNKLLFQAGAIAETQLISLESQVTGLQGQLSGLRSQVRQIDLQLQSLRLNRERMAVTSTIDGIVSMLPVVEGQMAMASTMVAMVVNIETLLLDVQVSENFIMGVNQGDELEVYIPSFSDQPVTGRVRTVPPNINPQTRAFSVTIEVDNCEKLIKGGMYAETHLVVERVENTVVIPQHAILRLEYGTTVFVEEDGVARMRPVTVGLTLGREAQILEGLREGEYVIVEGQFAATEGRRINVVARNNNNSNN